MLEEDLNHVGFISILCYVVPRFSKDQHACEFRDCLAL